MSPHIKTVTMKLVVAQRSSCEVLKVTCLFHAFLSLKRRPAEPVMNNTTTVGPGTDRPVQL